MNSISFERAVLGYPIAAEAKIIGQDISVNIWGGCRPHIGSISTAYPGESVSHTVFSSHRDDVVGDRFAAALSEHFDAAAVVTCGIHYDSPGKEGLAKIIECTELLLCDVIAGLSPFFQDH